MKKNTLTALSESQISLLTNNIIKSVTDIKQLNKPTYKYLMLCYGFIAHNDYYGFIDYYKNHSLKNDLIRNREMNMWKNFHPSDKDYEYYMSKAKVYKRVLDQIC